jgi:uncharacterized protein YraI
MNAWWFGTITITIPAVVFILRAFASIDREADRRSEFRWHNHEKYHRPPVRRGPVIDTVSRPLHTIDR